MPDQSHTREAARLYLASTLIYAGFRIIGATKRHAWDRAKVAAAQATIDKVVEVTGIRHPAGIPAGKMQITFEGGPADREVRIVDVCAGVALESDGIWYRYGRTDRMRGQSTIFALEVDHG